MKSDPCVTVDVRAIDVGYFSTKLTLGRKLVDGSSVIATALFPSLAPSLPATMSPNGALHAKPDGCVVTVDEVNYFVGKDAVLYSSGREPREVLDDYCLSPKYLALMRGAFNYMCLDAKADQELVINHLVLGLPLNTFMSHKDKLIAIATGDHLLRDARVPNGFRRITVEKTSVIVQPQGAMLSYGSRSAGGTKTGWSAVIDVGGGTLDWYVARGRTPNWQRSGAYSKSMLACAYAVADRIEPSWRDQFEIIERIDLAIREGSESFTTAGRVHKMAPHANAIEAVLKESTDNMLAKLGSLESIDSLLFTGGGAKVFKDYFAQRFPQYAAIMGMDEDPVFSNVQGFQIAGELMAMSAR